MLILFSISRRLSPKKLLGYWLSQYYLIRIPSFVDRVLKLLVEPHIQSFKECVYEMRTDGEMHKLEWFVVRVQFAQTDYKNA